MLSTPQSAALQPIFSYILLSFFPSVLRAENVFLSSLVRHNSLLLTLCLPFCLPLSALAPFFLATPSCKNLIKQMRLNHCITVTV